MQEVCPEERNLLEGGWYLDSRSPPSARTLEYRRTVVRCVVVKQSRLSWTHFCWVPTLAVQSTQQTMDNAKSWFRRVELSSEMTGLVRPTSKVYNCCWQRHGLAWVRTTCWTIGHRPKLRPRRVVPGLE
jgi:hypothetical protein